MAKKTKEPKVIQGSHSTRTEHPDGRIDFTIDWAKLAVDVNQAINDFSNKNSKKKKQR